MKLLEIWDFVLSPIYIFIIYQIAKARGIRKQKTEPYYKYFAPGILAKMLGGVCLCLIYTLYYGGGDTNAYHDASVCMNKLFFRNNACFWRLTFGALPYLEYSNFDASTGFPDYWRDVQSWQVIRWTCFFEFLGFRCYILTTIVLAAFTYFGIWRLYKVFMYYFPELDRQIAIAILFVPSVLFWGSGILKDTYTLSAAGLLTYCFHQVFILKKNRARGIFMAILASSLILKIKPYIFLGLVPGALLWISSQRIKDIKSPMVKILIAPVIFGFSIVLASVGFGQIKGDLGQYSSVDNILQKATATQKDLKQDYNKGNSFDIGEFDASISGIIKKLPVAIFAGLYRPTLLDVRNIVMLLAALENSVMLFILIRTVYRSGIRHFYSMVAGEPIVFFSLIFSAFFAFSVGLTTSNFGSLVRYKIPAVPFYFAAMLIIQDKEKKTENKFKTSTRKGNFERDREKKLAESLKKFNTNEVS